MAAHSAIKKTLILAWPLALNALLMQSMLMIDTLLISPLGEQALAGMGIAGTVIAFLLSIQIALSNGMQIVLGRAFGSDDSAKLCLGFLSGLLINALSSIAFLLLLFLFGNALILGLADDVGVINHAKSYLAIGQYLIVLTAVTQSITALFNATGDTKTPLFGYLLELPLNTLLSYLFIFQLDYGVAGAALGSVFGVVVRLIYLAVRLRSSKKISFFSVALRQFLTTSWINVKEIFPIAANFIILSVGHTLYQLLFSQLDVFSFAAVTLVFPWVRMGTQFVSAWAQASAISISQLVGQGQQVAAKLLIGDCIKVGLMLALLVSFSFLVLSLLIEQIYPQIDIVTYGLLASIAPLYILLPLLRSYNTVAGNALRAMGHSVSVLKVHVVSQWLITLPLCALMVLYFELPLFWAFAVLPFEEAIKVLPFYRMLKR